MERTEFTDEEISKIIEFYKNGKSLEGVAEEIGSSKSTIRRRLIENEVDRRPRGGAPGENVTIEYNRKYFNDIDCSKKAYWVGFLYADGWVSKYTVGVELSEKDESHLRELANEISYSDDLRRRTRELNGKEYNMVSLYLHSKEMADSLCSLGYMGDFPLNNISKSFHRDFWRGVVDGDGSLCWWGDYPRLDLTNTQETCEKYSNFCSKETGKEVNVHEQRNSYQVSLFSHDAVDMAETLYNDSEIYLPRKKKIYVDWKENYDNK